MALESLWLPAPRLIGLCAHVDTCSGVSGSVPNIIARRSDHYFLRSDASFRNWSSVYSREESRFRRSRKCVLRWAVLHMPSISLRI